MKKTFDNLSFVLQDNKKTLNNIIAFDPYYDTTRKFYESLGLIKREVDCEIRKKMPMFDYVHHVN